MASRAHLAQRAEEVLETVSPEARGTLPLILRELVSLSVEDDATPMRRVAPLAAFTSAPARELLQALLEARLFVSNLDDRGQPVVSVAHEALLEHWPRVRSWREQNREHLRAHARLSAAVRAWEREGRSRDFLLPRGKPLAEARALMADGVRLSEPEKALVDASDQARAALRTIACRRGRRPRRPRRLGQRGRVVRQSRVGPRARSRQALRSGRRDFLVSLFSIADPGESRGETVTVREVLDRGVDEIENSLSDEPAVRGNLDARDGPGVQRARSLSESETLLQQAVADAEHGEPRRGLDQGADRARIQSLHGRRNMSRRAPCTVKPCTRRKQLYGNKHDLVAASLRGLADSIFELDQPARSGAALSTRARDRARAARRATCGHRAHAPRSRHPALLPGELRRSRAALSAIARHLSLAVRREPSDGRAGSQRPRGAAVRHGPVRGGDPDVSGGGADLPEGLRRGASGVRLRHLQSRTRPADHGKARRRRELPATGAGDRPAAARAGHEDLILPLNSLAMLEIARGNLAEAEALLREALANAREHKHWMLGQVLTNVGDLDVRQRRFEQARGRRSTKRAPCWLPSTATSSPARPRGASPSWTPSRVPMKSSAGASPRRKSCLTAAWPVLRARFGARSYFGDQCLLHLSRLYEVQGNGRAAHEYRALLRSSPAAD